MKFNLIARKSKKQTPFSVSRRSTIGYMKPLRDWTVGLAVAVVTFLSGVSFITYDFYRQSGVPTQEVTAEYEPVVYQEKEVIRFSEMYEEKERAFNTLRERRVYITEPLQEVSDMAGQEPLADS
jgi:hypothetical protein